VSESSAPREQLAAAHDDPLSALSGANRAWIEELYARWLESPASVSPGWRRFFASWTDGEAPDPRDVVDPAPVRRSIFGGKAAGQAADQAVRAHKNAAVLQLISAYRRNGHLVADLDPLDLRSRSKPIQLTLAYHGLSEADLDTVFHGGRLAGPTPQAPLREILDRCESIYCGPLGSEFMYMRDETRRRWLERRIEESQGRFPLDRGTALRVLDKLMAADRFEQFIHSKYVGSKRFSVEGGEALIPLLDLLLQTACELGAKEAAIGMAHRGRLNVLANILGKAHGDIFEEFEDSFVRPEQLGSGDVKYHLGFSTDLPYGEGRTMHVGLAFNPSHLEFVGPVVAGQIRGKQDHFGDRDRRQAVPIVIHGDAAIAGQGIVAEQINLGRLPGYTQGGAIHVVLNNQVGFTTPPESARSSEHCTDIVKVLLLPVLHVNAEDLGAVAFVARLAAEYRQEFGQDIVIDLWCWRKYGHNEADEPAYTNPVMVRAIRNKKTPLERFVERMLQERVLSPQDVDAANARIREHLENELSRARSKGEGERMGGLWKGLAGGFLGGLWKGFAGGLNPAMADYITRVPLDKLRTYARQLTELPPGFDLNPKLKRFLQGRAELAEGGSGGPVDWSSAEALAYASLLAEGHPVRLSGQDSGRGTFSHRHAVLHDQTSGAQHVPLQRFGEFQVYDSPLSEAAVLAFEFGYTLVRPDALVVWEAQFGDFANGAQVIVDQFLSSSEVKWNRCSGLVLYLPHGYEGQGPEHSSARLERFLELSGVDNWRVMNLTTPAQLFHALRSQLHRNYRKPLILMTPKSLLRHPRVLSTLPELALGSFHPVMDDAAAEGNRDAVERVVLCSGKVYYDLLEARERRNERRVALLRVEQIYPFRDDLITEMLASYKHCSELVWCQEEPMNMGAWNFVSPQLREIWPGSLRYAGRERSSAPATGSKSMHDQEQAELVRRALEVGSAGEVAGGGN
jgi:2-oxoglutarate dehydrogenase E1 component